ncbi:hypothetical protein FOXG_20919 [Fusarium oxysporum f. sp. lycopersici 4287]|uniref:Uncharacterized protein n=1 Tax=Fusarium oxysporum f. sp. lycopersici (strain 4287 / CBS 123668 / FGSC 9935 / NRRL 34936) TaxID=426428 RepID=A0A0J9VSP9_FUSO4|nr:hypothetical protein FOXG_20919 [Fusarium oxysporum f. sp. lycopersici 4287]EWZ78170.1 hypothetical protein FOWG_17503 [Fusarium oxysporum f. sp. lycopersici MN25]KNB13781.1 hypothetical protein FOXG_20919 [Fusarium oxysporum f. sp. lycopersici 4287]
MLLPSSFTPRRLESTRMAFPQAPVHEFRCFNYKCPNHIEMTSTDRSAAPSLGYTDEGVYISRNIYYCHRCAVKFGHENSPVIRRQHAQTNPVRSQTNLEAKCEGQRAESSTKAANELQSIGGTNVPKRHATKGRPWFIRYLQRYIAPNMRMIKKQRKAF